jgi:outer membrane protein
MNKLLITLNAVLVLAVAFLFYKISGNAAAVEHSENGQTQIEEIKGEEKAATEARTSNQIATTPTGKIAFVNIDVINEKSEEVDDLVAELKRSRTSLEGSFESISLKYQTKMEEYQRMAKSGIAPQSHLEELGREIQNIQTQAENKQLQMDNLTVTMNEKNHAFQQGLKDFLVKWNNGRYDYILTYSDNLPSMLLGNASLDITEEIITKVNAEYKVKKANSKNKK